MELVKLRGLVSNYLPHLATDKFVAIIGVSPSRGARSPILWNAALFRHKYDAEMIAIDVSADNLSALIKTLCDTPEFIGGSVAAPYKGTVATFLGESVSSDVLEHGCVNALYRNRDGQLMGTNTDGLAAVISCSSSWGDLLGKRTMVMGLGGVGRPVAASFSKSVGQGNLVVTSRSQHDSEFADHLGASWVKWETKANYFSEIDLIVNCTSLGDVSHEDLSPLSQDEIRKCCSSSKVFDVIYQPKSSPLILAARKLGMETLSGENMNLIQAELAFAACFPGLNPIVTKDAMMDVFKDF